MPAKSKAQLRWVNSPAGHKALGESGVKEWNKATYGKRLPERLGKTKTEKAKDKLKRGMQGKSR